MLTGKKGRLEPLYSIFCLNLMTTTANTPEAMESAKSTGITIGGGSGPYRVPVTMPVTKVLSPDTQKLINRTQAVIDARALNIGIFSPPK